jgi:PepSY-associated TM region
MRALILLHRWLGVASCLLFAMWFASGIVMHFVPFPAFAEADRLDGLGPIDLTKLEYGPAEALRSSGIEDATRIRLIERSDGPVYVVPGSTRTAALHAVDLTEAAVHSQPLALAIATDYAAHRQRDAAAAEVFGPAPYDQWTVPSGFDRYRPLYRVALNDGPGTELYVSAITGEVVLDTTRRQRAWNYAGSIAHWIYPVALRSHPAAWSRLLWWLSFLALIGASAGAAIGMLRLGTDGSRFSPYRDWQAWHHWFGLCCMVFVLTWIFSGWLSMDSGALFSTGKPTDAEAAAITGAPAWATLSHDEIQRLPAAVREVEWFAFGGRIYRRERAGIDRQEVSVAGAEDGTADPDRAFLRPDEIDAAASHLGRSCGAAGVIGPDDDYAVASSAPGAPIFRLVCGDSWFDIDAANGALLEKLDASRRVYRWLYGALHTFDFPFLTARPALRTVLIVALCGCGFIFSLTGVVIAWRRLLSCFRSADGR